MIPLQSEWRAAGQPAVQRLASTSTGHLSNCNAMLPAIVQGMHGTSWSVSCTHCMVYGQRY